MAKEAKENDAPPAKLCFVIGPIGKDGEEIRKHSDLLLHSVIKQVLQAEPFRYHVKRADEDSDPGMIGDRVITDLLKAELVVADLTNLNPNAFYELGIRHASEKPTIHIARAGTALPFDNFAHRTIFVDLTDWTSIENARDALSKMAKYIEQPGFKVSNPITQANASFKMRESADPRDTLLSEIQENIRRLERELRVSQREGGAWGRVVQLSRDDDVNSHVQKLYTNIAQNELTYWETLTGFLEDNVDKELIKNWTTEHFGKDVFLNFSGTDGSVYRLLVRGR